MEDSTPEVYPSYKVKVDWRIWFPGKDVKDGFVEHGDRAYKIIGKTFYGHSGFNTYQ